MRAAFLLLIIAWPVLVPAVNAGTLVQIGDTADHGIAEGDPPAVVALTGTSIRVGANNNATPGGRNAVMIFPLPAIPAGEALASAHLLFQVAGRAGTPDFNGDLWGLGFLSHRGPLLEYLEADAGDRPEHTKLADNVLVPATPAGPVAVTSPVLGAYFRDYYAQNPGYGGGIWALLRLNPDADSGIGSVGWSIASAETLTNAPRLTLVTTNALGYTNAACTNFLVIITDDQRWDAMGVVQREMGANARFPWFTNGTPNLDRLAGEGIRFRKAFVTLSLCSPSRAAIQTGIYNHLNRIVDNQTPYPADSVSFATELRRAGYITGWIGKWHMGTQVARPGYDFAASYTGQGNYSNTTFYVNGLATPTVGWVDDVSTEYALAFMETNLHRPFALVVGYKATHGPRTPPSWAAPLYTGQYAATVPNLEVLAPWRATPAQPGTNDLQNYFRCLTAMDACVGRLLEAVDVYGLATNTMIIFAGDNGYYLGEHGLGDKRSAYEESIRIPLIVRYPGLIPRAALRDEMVLNIDIAPTILEAAAVPVPPAMQGLSWCPLFTETGASWRQSFLYQYFLETGYTSPTTLAIRTSNAKLVLYPGQPTWTELFRLDLDPYETNNLYGTSTHSALLQELSANLIRLSAETGLTAALGNPSVTATSVSLTITGGLGPRYQIESASGLDSMWHTLSEVKMVTSTNSVSVPATNSAPSTFYRAKMIAE